MNSITRLAVLLAALSAVSSAFSAPKIGFLGRDRDLFWAAAEKGAVEAAATAGVDLISKAPPNANSLSHQLTMLAALQKEPLDALIISPLTVDEFKEPIAAFKAKGTKILVLETKVPEGFGHTYLGYNQVEMAETAARNFAALIHDGDEIGVLRANSLEGVSVRERTLLATLKQLRPASTIHTDVMSGLEKGDDYDRALVLLERHPNIKAVCTPFTASSLAMIKALKARNLAGKIIHVGFGVALPADAADAIEAGALQGWISQQPKLFGTKGIAAALDLVNGKPVPATIDVPYFWVTPANVKSAEIQALRN